jgi:hypothetical protein
MNGANNSINWKRKGSKTMKSGSDEKKSKVGPREQQLRDMRAARVAKNKELIDQNAKTIGTALRSAVKTKVKAKAQNVAGKIKERVKAKVVQFKAKRGRTGR